ncbi:MULTISPECIES: hypothetical protein [unclassified Mesorhizobium]|uniref:hypothetical protein n=1 Tax=unclassified Mesorhizobium TaxID=325217 RepID=UPI000F764FDF|nr:MULTISPECIES: hypothetical protein [unclassified Mesorhizobium]AZO54844.1 hypothetical protein EJ077_16355 [Mesorhizobium sp. M8A.F.Ca.ET.057.01.1.1]RWE44173.1 MAG: hypothetical protein EOS80_19705 [Mesorhizobium sp.]
MRFKPTFEFTACRINAVQFCAQADGLSTITIIYSKVRDPNVGWPQEFIGGLGFTSWRLQRLLSAVGIVGELTDPDQLVGRYFAIKDGGSQPDHFASLEYASACLQSDRQAFEAAKAYAEECAAEEEADAAMEAYLETGIEAFSRKAARCAA